MISNHIVLQKSINLTPNELELFDLLKNFVKNESVNVVLRVAGGWVRDKVFIPQFWQNNN